MLYWRAVDLDLQCNLLSSSRTERVSCLYLNHEIDLLLNQRSGAGLTTKGLYHYPAKITNPKVAWEIAQFAPATADNITTTSSAAVINVIDGRQQVSLVRYLKLASGLIMF